MGFLLVSMGFLLVSMGFLLVSMGFLLVSMGFLLVSMGFLLVSRMLGVVVLTAAISSFSGGLFQPLHCLVGIPSFFQPPKISAPSTGI